MLEIKPDTTSNRMVCASLLTKRSKCIEGIANIVKRISTSHNTTFTMMMRCATVHILSHYEYIKHKL